jgi:hypothetical protein
VARLQKISESEAGRKTIHIENFELKPTLFCGKQQRIELANV